jgi:Domain of unknown function (DUF4253)
VGDGTVRSDAPVPFLVMVDEPREHRRSARGPAVPFVASRPGEVPPSGAPTIAGIDLPAGIACPHDRPPAYWRTVEPVEDPGRLTSPLAEAFARTGLWPLLYAWEEEPEHYWFGGPGVSDDLPVDIEEVMRSQWESWKQATWGPKPIFPEFPGLAEAQATSADGASGDPFALVNDDARRASWDPMPSLLLVPCRRPADILAVLGWDFSQMPHALMTALLRSWEERFAAVPVEIDLATIVLNIGRPPQTEAQAERLVAEFAAVCEFSVHEDEADWLHRTASVLLPDSPIRALSDDLSPTHWRISFQETPPDTLFELVEGLQ